VFARSWIHLVASVPAGRLSDRFGRYRVLVPGLALLLVSQLLMFLIHDQVTYLIVGLFQGEPAG